MLCRCRLRPLPLPLPGLQTTTAGFDPGCLSRTAQGHSRRPLTYGGFNSTSAKVCGPVIDNSYVGATTEQRHDRSAEGNGFSNGTNMYGEVNSTNV